jgi:hypothetical protein
MIVATTQQLLEALGRPGPGRILVNGLLKDVPSITLLPGQSLENAKSGQGGLQFLPDEDGIRLTCGNRVHGLSLAVSAERRAIFNDDTREDAGMLSLSNLQLCGQVQVLARNALRAAEVCLENIFISDADTRVRPDVATGNGVAVLQGAITVWNQQVGGSCNVSCKLQGIRIGSQDRPVRGGGIFLSGCASPGGGHLEVERLDVETVYADSGLPEGTTGLVAAAVFVLQNARAKQVRCRGDVETFGPNCVALDNWGEVEEWSAEGDVLSHGPSAVAIINAGTLGRLHVVGRVETFGQGARCVSIYSDTGTLEFKSLCTRGDGATAVQVTRELKKLVVLTGIETYGGQGAALVKGRVEVLRADCINIEPPGRINEWSIAGPIIAHRTGMTALQTHT